MSQKNQLCASPGIFAPDTACHEGCPVLSKIRHVVVPQGVCAILEWPLRHPDGRAVDLTTCFPQETSTSVSESKEGANAAEAVAARFADCDGNNILEIEGAVHDYTTGKIRFAVPTQVYDTPGIYQLSMAILQEDSAGVRRPIFVDSGLLSVEGTLWGNRAVRTRPPTLGEIRMHLRDTAVENDLLADVEFDDQELIQALVRPIQQWNEIPPPVAPFTCNTFPFRYHWLQAVVGELLTTAAHHYMRNNLKMNHAGLAGNFKDRYREYLGLAERYRQEWKDFVTQKKIEINASMGMGSAHSAYGGYY